MKKFLFLLAFTMSCQRIKDDAHTHVTMFRCENEEAICYISDFFKGGGMSCKFKSDNVKKSQNEDRKDD